MAYSPRSSSPYSAPSRSPKWPWVFASILVVALIATSTLLIQNGLPIDTASPTNNELALLTPTPNAILVTTPDAAGPTPTPVRLDDPNQLVEEWVNLWMQEDYASMYQLTSAATRNNMTQSAFVNKYSDIARITNIYNIFVDVKSEVGSDNLAEIQITYESALLGTLKQQNVVQVIQETQGWRVVWSPASIFTELGANGCIAWTGEKYTRGRILDTNGRVLAEDVPVTRVGVIPANVIDPDVVYPELARVLDMDLKDIEARVKASPNASWSVILKDMPSTEEINLLNAFRSFTGVSVKSATQRSYPYGPVAVHLVGYVTLANAEDIAADEMVVEGQLIGRTGIEYGANEILAGKPGGVLSAVDCSTRTKREEIATVQGQPPADVYLTVDIEFQKQVDAALTTAEKEIDGPKDEKITIGERGAVVVLDPETGAVLAMVSHPTFDPNGYITNDFSEEDIDKLNDPVMLAWLNRAVNQALPTGSIFKSITMAGALDTLGYTDQTLVDCPAVFTIGDQSWADWVVENGVTAQGVLTLHQALVNSCNTVFYGIGAAMDAVDRWALPTMARAFGLGEPVDMLYFPSGTSGIIPDPDWKLKTQNDGWATGDNVQLAIGQGFMTATPLQMAVAYAAIANGGDVLQPYVVDYIQTSGYPPEQVGQRIVRNTLPLSSEQIGWIQNALRSQTSDPYGYGSTRIFGDFPWSISGKTGTAQNDRANEDGRPHSWFAAYAPFPGSGETPEIASIVMIENVGEGITYAAPVTKIIFLDWMQDHGISSMPIDQRLRYVQDHLGGNIILPVPVAR